MNATRTNLTGKLLIAMPDMGDPRFAQTVIYMCSHSRDGAMGLIVNKPQTGVKFNDLLQQLGIKKDENVRDIRIHFGGPVEHARGFVLHSADYSAGEGTMHVTPDVSMSATLDVLEDIGQGRGPNASMLALGYAGWGRGQLEDELASNGWLVGEPRDDIIFGRANEHKWSAALKAIGVDPLLLSPTAGRA